ncbi:MAG: hypothetical protein QOG43_2212 [Actinomycetota bacterium]|nr:hypothetical protein [Actinomycetota bacterium]
MAGVLVFRSSSTPSAPLEIASPAEPPARICGSSVLDGPERPPDGAVTVDAGEHLSAMTKASPPGTTFWLAPGVHTLGTGPFNQVTPKDGDVFVGGPGAVIDGQTKNRYAFAGDASDVVVRNLTIQNFGTGASNRDEGVVNHDGGRGWLIERSTVRDNDGAGVFVGSDNVLRENCLTANGQYGFSMFKKEGLTSITIDHNEISGNNTDDWETRQPRCGCTGGGKFWDVTGAVVTANWVHDNRGVGLWADTNNVGFRFEQNYINDNDAEGLFYEISYNALIRGNTLKRNALVKGRVFAARQDPFPVGAIYLSESGGDNRVNGGVYATLEVVGNLLEDNWSGVVLWENADRFCNSAANTSGRYCTKVGGVTRDTCSAGAIEARPAYSDCRWKTQNVWVHGNEFRMDRDAIGCSETTTSCGLNGLISNFGSFPQWSPYKGRVVQDDITFGQGNRFSDNRYVGDWKFSVYEPALVVGFREWRSPPYKQDHGSAKK